MTDVLRLRVASRVLFPGLILALALTLVPTTAATAQGGGDWPQWGRDASRNMVSTVKGLPDEIVAGKYVKGTENIDMATTKNIKWVAKVGSQCYGNPTVANGRVYIGTNNDSPRDPRFRGDRSCVYCLDEKTGAFLWQFNIPKLGTGKVSDWEFLGVCSSPAVEGDRVYLVTNRCEVVCLDVHGLKNGNQGFQDEGQYMADNGKPAIKVEPQDADILWKFNMIDECGVFPHNITSCSVMVVGEQIWTSTSNGVDYGHVETPAPNAPCLIVLDKQTGKLLGEESSGLSQRIFHSNWGSPAYLKTADTELVIYGGPDGVLYAFHTKPVKEEDFDVLKVAWSYDCNPPHYRKKDGKPIRYATSKGPSEVLGTPIVHDGLVYAVIGQDPEHGEGIGNLSCVDARGKKVWDYQGIMRSMTTMAVHKGLLFAADYSGFLYCFDAKTGTRHWRYDTAAHIWGSVLVADDKVYIGTEDGFLVVLPATKEYDEKKAREYDFTSPIYSSPIAANGVLYISTHTHLFAVAKPSR